MDPVRLRHPKAFVVGDRLDDEVGDLIAGEFELAHGD